MVRCVCGVSKAVGDTQQRNMSETSKTEAFDYDSDPERFRSNVKTVERYGLIGDVHTEVAGRIIREALWPALDMGCGEGRLKEAFGEHRLFATDLSRTMLERAPDPRFCSDMTRLPVRDASFGSAAALWCLYHVTDPVAAIREAWRILRAGGLFVACSANRDNDPEFAHLFPEPNMTPFDAEESADLVGEAFGEVEVDRWDVPAVTLPDEDAVALYLRGRGMTDEEAADTARDIETPITLTKRGAMVWAYKR